MRIINHSFKVKPKFLFQNAVVLSFCLFSMLFAQDQPTPETQTPQPQTVEIPEESVITSFSPSRSYKDNEPEQPGTLSTSSNGVNQYVIVSGDTLWDICASLMGDPFFWPKLWSLNKYIQNPHLIYPGQVLRFFEGSESQLPKMTIGEEIVVENKVLEENDSLNEGVIIQDKKFEFSNSNGELKVNPEVFISTKKINYAGQVVHTTKGKILLSYGDQVIVKFNKGFSPKVGQKILILNKMEKLKGFGSSPRRNMGHLIRRMAQLEIVRVGSKQAEAKVLDNEYAFRRNDKFVIGERKSFSIKPLDSRSTNKKIRARIVESSKYRLMMSSADYVIIDRGSKQGVKEGMQFDVLVSYDPVHPGEISIPDWITKGKLVAIEVYDNMSITFATDVRNFEYERGSHVLSGSPK